MRQPILAAFALLTAAASAAHATDVCTVQESRDGFAALRAAPSPQAKLIARAKPGEALVIQKNDKGDLIEIGQWLRVFHFPGEVAPDASDPEYAKGRTGWMHRGFVDDCG